MDTIELRIALTEEILRELLWEALVPEALVITKALTTPSRNKRSCAGSRWVAIRCPVSASPSRQAQCMRNWPIR